MGNFIVGGFVPGTDIQFGFLAYLTFMSGLFGVIGLIWFGLKRHESRQDMIAVYVRQPLHASQLHRRV